MEESMSKVPRSADALVDHLLKTPELLDQAKSGPEDTLRKLAKQVTRDLPPPAFVTDPWTYRPVTDEQRMTAQR
jgi:hypothetical protein